MAEILFRSLLWHKCSHSPLPLLAIDAVLVATVAAQGCKQNSISHTHLQCHFSPHWVWFGAHSVPEDLLINFGLSGSCPSLQTLKTPCTLLARRRSSQLKAGTGCSILKLVPFWSDALELWECSLSLFRWGAAVNVAPEHWGQGEWNKVPPEPQSRHCPRRPRVLGSSWRGHKILSGF